MMLLSCLVESASLTYFSLLDPSLCALLQPLAQSGSTFLMWGRALQWEGGGVGGVLWSPSLKAAGGRTLWGQRGTGPPAHPAATNTCLQ